MTVPLVLPRPWLAAEPGATRGATLLEWAALLDGEHRTDEPACVHPVLAGAVRAASWRLADEPRQDLLGLLGALVGTASAGAVPARLAFDERALDMRLGCWCAEQVLRLVPQVHQDVCRTAVAMARAWCAGTVTAEQCEQVNRAVLEPTRGEITEIAENAMLAFFYASYPGSWGDGGERSAARAVRAAAAAPDADLPGFVTGLVGEYDRLTGRDSWRTVTDTDLAGLAVLAGLSR